MSRAREWVLAAYMACAVLLHLTAICFVCLWAPAVWAPLEVAALLCSTLVLLGEDGG